MTKKGNGFALRLSREKLIECSKLSARERLEWLEEANNFINKALTKEKKARWELMKNKA